jgi:hypothetical protein
VTRNNRLTVEELAVDCLDVRELYKTGALDGGWVTFRWPEFRWPGVRKMRAARYLILIELLNQTLPQQIRVSWTNCNYGGAWPWLHCLCGRRVVRLFKGFAPVLRKSGLREPATEQEGAVLLAGISSPTTAWRIQVVLLH